MIAEIPFGRKLKDLTPMQETVLTILYLSEKLANYPLESDQTFYASGQFFLHMNGIIFESYHRKLMRQLAALGWVKIIDRSGTLYYGLTRTGLDYKTRHKNAAQRCAIGKIS